MKNLKKSIKINKIKEIDDSYSLCSLDNIFSVFNSINNILYLIYTKENKAIILYDIIIYILLQVILILIRFKPLKYLISRVIK